MRRPDSAFADPDLDAPVGGQAPLVHGVLDLLHEESAPDNRTASYAVARSRSVRCSNARDENCSPLSTPFDRRYQIGPHAALEHVTVDAEPLVTQGRLAAPRER
jgi:hypothetical protein